MVTAETIPDASTESHEGTKGTAAGKYVSEYRTCAVNPAALIMTGLTMHVAVKHVTILAQSTGKWQMQLKHHRAHAWAGKWQNS